MANLKDTIVLGNLTVTGKVVASDILVSGTGNEFDTINVNAISSKDDSFIDLYTSGFRTEDSFVISSTDECGITAPRVFLTTNNKTLSWDDGILLPENSGDLGTDTNRWTNAYFHAADVNMGLTASQVTTSTIYYGGTLNLDAEAGTKITTGLYPSGSATIGGSKSPFSNIYGTTVTTTSTYADTLYTKKIRARQGASTGTGAATGQIQIEPSTYGWKLSGDSNISTAYSASIYPATGGTGRVGVDYNHFAMSWIDYMCVYTLYPIQTSSTTYGKNVGRIGTDNYYFNAGYIKTIYRTTESGLSDVRLKTNITNNTLNALNVINQLDIIDFKYLSDQKSDMRLQKERSKAINTMKTLEKTKETKELRKTLQQIISTPNNSKATTIGISAQQLESLLPPQYRKTFITKESTENYSDQYYLKENRLVYLAMKAIQEQQEIIDKLQARIEILEQGDK